MTPPIQSPAAAQLPPNFYNATCWITGQPEIGADTWIGAFTLIDGLGGLKIGRGCNISSGVQILSHSTARRCVTERKHAGIDYLPTTIGDYVFIGANTVIQMGANIGHHSIIGAGAVVLEATVIPPYSLVVGLPARIVRDLRQEITRWSQSNHA